MKTQEKLEFPSLRNEVHGFLAKFGIPDVTRFSKVGWKRFVKNSIHELNRIQLLDDIKQYKKLDFFELGSEEYKVKDYFSKLDLESSRMKFRVRSQTVTSCATHYPSDPENIRNMFECREKCTFIDSIFHWENSDCYKDLKMSNPTTDQELCLFYKRVIQHRMESPGMKQ